VTRVSAISVFHDREHAVDESVRSLLDQTHDDLEIVLVDDGSTDGTLDALRRYEGDPRVVIRTHANQGFTPSIRAAVEAATGDAIAVHGSGDLSKPERVARQVAVLDAEPDVVAVGCWFHNTDAETGRTVDVRQPAIETDARAQLIRSNPFSHGEVTFRRKAYEQVGGYREAFRFSQDFDLWLRLVEVGRLAVVPEDLYVRYLRRDGVSRSTPRTLVQRMLREFAVQCAHERAASGDDWVDRFGPAGLLFWQPSPAMAKQMLRHGRRELLFGDEAEAARWVRLAARHRPTPVAAGLSALTTLSERSPSTFAATRRLARVVKERVRG
jgi:glycosyltransferase involved in cell wall biosynthesis